MHLFGNSNQIEFGPARQQLRSHPQSAMAEQLNTQCSAQFFVHISVYIHCFSYVYHAGEQDEAAEVAEQLFRCNETCPLHRAASMCTLWGDEITQFADRVDLEIS